MIEGKRGMDTFASTNLDALRFDNPMISTPMTATEFVEALG